MTIRTHVYRPLARTVPLRPLSRPVLQYARACSNMKPLYSNMPEYRANMQSACLPHPFGPYDIMSVAFKQITQLFVYVTPADHSPPRRAPTMLKNKFERDQAVSKIKQLRDLPK